MRHQDMTGIRGTLLLPCSFRGEQTVVFGRVYKLQSLAEYRIMKIINLEICGVIVDISTDKSFYYHGEEGSTGGGFLRVIFNALFLCRLVKALRALPG